MMWSLLPLAAYAQSAPSETDTDFRSYVDQARFFIKRDWYPDAAEQLELAVATEDGALDPEAWFLLAQVRYELAELYGARFAADRALVNSRDPETTRRTRELLTFFETKFGFVTVRGPQEATATLLDVDLESTLFDPELRVFLTRLQDRVGREPVVLPQPLGLPAGRYTINGAAVEVSAGSAAELTVPLQGTRSTTLQTLQLEVSAGVSLPLGPDAAHLIPAPSAQLALSAPWGPVVVGVLVDWVPTVTLTETGTTAFGALGGGAGARVGFELPNTAPMVVRPSLGYRLGTHPSLEVTCTVTGTQATCGDGPPELYVYASGLAHTPFAELAVYYQNRRQRSSWGAGIKTVAEVSFATLPAASTADALSGARYEVDVVDGWRARTVPGIRLLGELSFAF